MEKQKSHLDLLLEEREAKHEAYGGDVERFPACVFIASGECDSVRLTQHLLSSKKQGSRLHPRPWKITAGRMNIPGSIPTAASLIYLKEF